MANEEKKATVTQTVKSVVKVKTKSFTTRWLKFKGKTGLGSYITDIEFIVYRGILVNLTLLALYAFFKRVVFPVSIVTILGGGAVLYLLYEFLEFLGLDDKFNPERQRRQAA